MAEQQTIVVKNELGCWKVVGCVVGLFLLAGLVLGGMCIAGTAWLASESLEVLDSMGMVVEKREPDLIIVEMDDGERVGVRLTDSQLFEETKVGQAFLVLDSMKVPLDEGSASDEAMEETTEGR